MPRGRPRKDAKSQLPTVAKSKVRGKAVKPTTYPGLVAKPPAAENAEKIIAFFTEAQANIDAALQVARSLGEACGKFIAKHDGKHVTLDAVSITQVQHREIMSDRPIVFNGTYDRERAIADGLDPNNPWNQATRQWYCCGSKHHIRHKVDCQLNNSDGKLPPDEPEEPKGDGSPYFTPTKPLDERTYSMAKAYLAGGIGSNIADEYKISKARFHQLMGGCGASEAKRQGKTEIHPDVSPLAPTAGKQADVPRKSGWGAQRDESDMTDWKCTDCERTMQAFECPGDCGKDGCMGMMIQA